MEAATADGQQRQRDGEARRSLYVVLQETRPDGPADGPTAWVVVTGEPVEAGNAQEAEQLAAASGEDDGRPRTGTFRAVPVTNWRGASRFNKRMKPVVDRERVD